MANLIKGRSINENVEKVYRFFLYVLVLLVNIISVSALEPPPIYGDSNSDCKVNSTDLTLMKRYLLQQSISYINLINADLNGDGKINSSDYMLASMLVSVLM